MQAVDKSRTRRRRTVIYVLGGLSIAFLLAHFVLRSMFFNAVFSNNVELVQKPLRVDPLFVRSTYQQGSTALNTAAEAGAVELVRLLLRKGADPNHDCINSTPLHMASFRDRRDVVDLLLEAGASVDSETHWPIQNVVGTPLHQAASNGT